MSEFRTEVAGIRQVVEETRDECRNEVQQTKAQTQQNTRDISGLREHARLKDKCEVLVLGLPVEWEGTYGEAAEKLVTALELLSSILHGAYYREWDPKSRQNRRRAATTKAFVIEFDTPKNRDKFIEASPKLKYKSGRTVFGVGGFGLISLRPLWPHSVHRLMSLAVRISKEQSWPRPVVDNLVVRIRVRRATPSIPIFCEEDLMALVEKHGTHATHVSSALPQAQVSAQIAAVNNQAQELASTGMTGAADVAGFFNNALQSVAPLNDAGGNGTNTLLPIHSKQS